VGGRDAAWRWAHNATAAVRVCEGDGSGFGAGAMPAREVRCEAEEDNGERGGETRVEVNQRIRAAVEERRANDISMDSFACCK
jgi:hypothetical protein